MDLNIIQIFSLSFGTFLFDFAIFFLVFSLSVFIFLPQVFEQSLFLFFLPPPLFPSFFRRPPPPPLSSAAASVVRSRPGIARSARRRSLHWWAFVFSAGKILYFRPDISIRVDVHGTIPHKSLPRPVPRFPCFFKCNSWEWIFEVCLYTAGVCGGKELVYFGSSEGYVYVYIMYSPI